MYFDFEDNRPDTPHIGPTISKREMVLVTFNVHLLAIILILVAPHLPFMKALERQYGAPASLAAGDASMSVLHEHSFGERSRWDVDYAAFARAKAELSWRHGIDSRRLQMLEPHRLVRGESRLWGGVNLDGIVVAASGAEPIWDEAFALQVAGYLRSLAWLRSRLMSR